MESIYKNVQIENEFHEKLREIAAQERRSMSGMVEILILREWQKHNSSVPATTDSSESIQS
jgi:hypothetical protein